MLEAKVGSTTNVSRLSQAIAETIKAGDSVKLSCIGVQAINQACKSVVRANTLLVGRGKILAMIPSMERKHLEEGMVTTGMDFRLVLQDLG